MRFPLRLVAIAVLAGVLFGVLSLVAPGLAEPHRIGIATGLAVALTTILVRESP
jgi:hypothetical protein